MRKFTLPLLLLFLALPILVFPAFSMAAEESVDDAWTVNMYLENDLFGDTDQNYTNGIRFSLVSPNLESFRDDPAMPPLLNKINDRFDRLLGFKQGPTKNVVISLGQIIYTPEDYQAYNLIEDDRPYAGYLYLGFAYHTRNEDRLDTVEINLGMVGPSAQGELAQDSIHNIRDIEKFNGWDNQLSDEPTLQLIYEQKRRFFKHKLPLGLEQDFITHAGGGLGNVGIYANIGGEYRFGWELPEDFGTSAVRPGGDNSAPGKGDIRLRKSSKLIYGLHGFVSLDARAVAHDIFLDGNTWKDSHSVDKEYFVTDISVGASVLIGDWKLSYAQVYRTREFKEQPKSHEYGSLSISYTW